MSNSTLVNHVKISPHRTSPRSNAIKKITIHHMAGNLSVETCGNVFQSREASSNYGIDSTGRVGMYVEEKDRSWCSSSGTNDHQAVTIEVADDKIGGGWHSSDEAMQKWFVSTDCPGAYLEGKFAWIAEQVNKVLSGGSYTPPKPSTPSGGQVTGKLAEDGSWGPGTTTRTQQHLGTVADGIISNQPVSNKRYLYSAHTSTWKFKDSGCEQGSNMIRALQKKIGATANGWFDRDSVLKLQAFLGIAQDGSMGPGAVRAWQGWLNNH